MNLKVGDRVCITQAFQERNAQVNGARSAEFHWPLGSFATIVSIYGKEIRIENDDWTSVSTTYEIALGMRQAYLEKS